MKQLKLLFLFICLLSIWQIKAQTITVTPTVNWSCGNENISPSNYNFIAAQQSTFRSNQPAPTSGNWVIPVVVHVLFDAAHANDPAHNISYQQIQWQINQLNRGFQNLISPGSTPRDANTQIQFCLAQTSMGPNWTNNAERGVMRYQVPASTLSHTMDLAGQTTLLTLTHSLPTNFPFQNYLNIWLVDTITDLSGSIPNKNVIGYSNFPNTISGTNPLDGVVIRHDAFGSNNIPNHHNILISQLDKGNILTHEVGHYLNMLHTFEGGCVGTNSTTCLSQGDLICDTPPSTLTNINVCGGQNTCSDNLPAYSGDQLDMLENFMCYADDDCMVAFTIDQTAVMQGVLNTPWPAGRQDLTTTANLAATGLTNAGVNCCPTGVTTAYFTTTQTVCSAVSFSCIVPSCSMNQTYFWEFGDGNTATVTTNTISHTYTVSGLYSPTLTVTGTNGSVDVYSKTIQVGTYAKSTAKDVCNLSSHGIAIHVTGSSGTYSLDFNMNGNHTTHTYSINPNLQSSFYHAGSEDIQFNVPINLPQISLPAQHIYTVTLSGANTCSLTYVDTFRVSNCCNNVVTNGNFSDGYNGFTRPNGGYVGTGPGVIWPYTPSMHFDSPFCGVPSTCNSLEMYNTIVSLQGGINYHLNFQAFGGNPSTMKINGKYMFMDTLFLNPRVLDNSGNVIRDLGIISVLDLVDTTWHHYDFIFTVPSTITNARLSISQVKNFYSPGLVAYYGPSAVGWGYDYDIDEVSIRAVGNPPTVIITPSVTTSCAGTSNTLTATGASTYSWSTGATTSTTSVAPSSSTVYTVIGTSILNCTATAQGSININPSLISITPSSPTICIGQSILLTASGGLSYTWNTGATTSTLLVTPTVTTVYSVSATNTLTGCNNIRTVTVSVNPLPSLTITPSSYTYCLTQSAVLLTATGATSYTWNTGAITSTINVSPSVNTIYTVQGTALGCVNSKTISINSKPIPTVAVNSPTICSGQTTTLTASGANTYSWNTTATTASISVSPATTTNYTVIGTLNGCSSTKTSTVTVKISPTLTVIANPTSICSGQSSTLSVSGASTYSWSTGATTSNISISPTVTTIYTVTGTNTISCSSSKTVSLIVGAYTPTITAFTSSFNACGAGSATLSANGATSYTWMPGSITNSLAVVSPTAVTIYTVSGTYGTGCGISTATTLVNPVISTLCCTAPSTIIGTSLTSSVNFAAGNYTVSGTIIDMQGTVTIIGTTSFTGYTFRMAPNSLLKVIPSVTLTLTNCKLFSCSELWNGIMLLGEWGNNSALNLNNTSIEDMYNGIVLDYGTAPFSRTGSKGTINITNSILNKNYVGIQIKNSTGSQGNETSYPFSITTSTISSYASITSPGAYLKPSSTYTYAYKQITNGSGNTSAPYLNFPRSFIGISLENLGNGIPVTIGNYTSTAITNTFDNLDFGIYGTEVKTIIQNNYFKNITGSVKSVDPLQIGGAPPADGPDEIGIAIAITQTATPYNNGCRIGKNEGLPSNNNPFPWSNKFEDCNKGARIINCSDFMCGSNVFTTTTTSIPVSTTSGWPPTLIINPNTYYFYKGQSAIWSVGVGQYAEIASNIIRNHSIGIYNNHSITSSGSGQVSITDNDIAAPSSTGYCRQAIQVAQVGGYNLPTNGLSIVNNTIDQVYCGIVANSVLNGLWIQNPHIFVEDVAKTVNYSATQQRTGIILNNCEYALVKGNVISSNASSIPTTSTTSNYLNGVYLTNSKLGKIECNSTTNLGRCFVFQGTCDNSWKVNNMSNSYTGLEIRTLGRIGQQGASSGAPNLSANTWTTITRETNIISSAGNNTISPLYVASGAGTQPTLNFGTAGHTYSTGLAFGIRVVTGTSYTCNEGSAERMTEGDNTGINYQQKVNQSADSLANYISLAKSDENTYDVFTDEFIYQNKQLVYKLLNRSDIQSAEGSSLANFYDAYQNTAIGKLTEVQEAISNNSVNDAINKNTSVSVSNQAEYKHQRSNELMLKYLNNRMYAYTSDEKRDIYDMANECIVKGYYVVQARNLLNIITHQITEYEDLCEAEANAMRRTKGKTEEPENNIHTSFNLFPNPNNGNMVLDYDLGTINNAVIKLYDITGKFIKSYKLETSKGMLEMNEQNLHNGIYFYHILVEDKTIKTDKIVVIK